jgi:murein DD-endopeptidase MepM/ murein hydrolase activator NlpD
MSGDRWTFMLLKGTGVPVRQFSVAPGRLKRLGTVGGVLGLGLMVLAVWAGIGGSARIEARQLRDKNAVLTAELAQLQERIAMVEGSLGELADRNAEVRNLAGLEAIDGEVLRVGVGGPGSLTPDAYPLWQLDHQVGSEAFAASYDLSALERRARLLSESFAVAGDSLTARIDLLQATPSIMPTSGWLSSRFNRSRVHPILNESRPHYGIDVSADAGTPILAAAKGRVVRAGWVPGLGNMVEIDHGYGYVTRYGHASRLHVRAGETVERGDLIAQVGSSGLATGPHLHYEIYVNGEPRNPMNFVIPADGP